MDVTKTVQNRILKYFAYGHLPMNLQSVSREFHVLANWIEESLPDGPEKTVAMRKLLESKDAAVRAKLDV
jgi:hypothetical protein